MIRGKIADDKICHNDDNRYIILSCFGYGYFPLKRHNDLNFQPKQEEARHGRDKLKLLTTL